MDEKQLKERLRSGKIGGAYIFAGEEDYLKRYYLAQLRRAAVTDPSLATFNHIVFDGQGVSFASVTDAIKAPPMFEEYKLIEWRYPSFVKMREGDLAAFEETLDLLPEHHYAVFAIIVADGECELGTEKKPSKFERRFSKKADILNFPRSTEPQLLSWLKKHFDAEGITVSKEALSALIFRSGRAMDILCGEVAKLSLYIKARGRCALEVSDVNEVASSTPECDTFALTNAILERNKRAAFIALDEMKRQRQDPIMIMGMMAKTYSELLTVKMMLDDGMEQSTIESELKMHPFRLKSYIRASRLFKAGSPAAILEELSRVDVGSKYGGVSGYTAVEMFVSKCL